MSHSVAVLGHYNHQDLPTDRTYGACNSLNLITRNALGESWTCEISSWYLSPERTGIFRCTINYLKVSYLPSKETILISSNIIDLSDLETQHLIAQHRILIHQLPRRVNT